MLVNPDSGQVERYEIMLTDVSLTLNGSTSEVSNGSLPVAVLLDSGSQLSQVPSDIVDNIAAVLGLTSSDLRNGFPCDMFSEYSADDTSNDIFSFSFDNGTTYVNVPFHELIVPDTNDGGSVTDQNGNIVCVLGMVPLAPGPPTYDSSYILGDTFLRSAYVAYDIDNLEIYVGKTVFNSTTSNITSE
ncbi:acid protease [Saitoella complicata NRRL Y-17804]|uniref:Peptidase A1 domain-containing protein n=1 Tax=Saitoella complicata (strain BCRC 22490 / CBS 7301 / JCM 7358 / NBRC 10748 / NRRL Y-17804) TaxID=698492 RepID=A0A0E9NHT8_SAICN|nr:acid protease [Saitoella complicata NRRL Y-17804]ODQ53065.1 acid protease [Saitoella complicata NRRL Y-17804]GAO48970.1 hypothetical protein G7K_3131-t1 [Saitoella complicata NRRL Y-17804]